MAAAAAGMVGQGGGVPGGLGGDTSTAAAVQAAAANLAAAMRLGVTQANNVSNSNPSTPPITNEALSAQAAAMNAMRASMDSMRNMDAMRSSVMDMASPHGGAGQQQDAALRMHQAEALLRSQAEAALRLAVSQVSIFKKLPRKTITLGGKFPIRSL